MRRQLFLVGFSDILNYGVLIMLKEFVVLKHSDILDFLDPLYVVISIQEPPNLEVTIDGELLLVDSVHGHATKDSLGKCET